MAETLIFEDDIGTAYVELFSCYAVAISPPPFSLTIGEKYKVVWDGQSFDVKAVDGSAVGSEVIMGNGTPFGLDGNDEPFAVVYTSNADVIFAALTDTASTVHTVAVYHVTEDEPSVDPEEPEEPVVQEGIVLKDRNGNDVAYYGIETVTFDTTTEGKQQTYTKGVAVEGLEIVPDFSGGDMAITAAEGTLVKSATIKVPDTLTPENVRNGVNVGGVAGTFIGNTEEATVELAMADGDMVVEPSADGKVLSSVTIKKPETLIPANIALGINIAGIVGESAGSGNVLIKKYTAYPGTTGIVTLATADELATVGFDTSGKCFVALVPTASAWGYLASPGSVLAAIVVNYYITNTGGSTPRYYGIYLSSYSSGTKAYGSYGAITSNPFSGSVVDNTPYYADGEIRYNMDSTMKLYVKSGSSGYQSFYVIAGNLKEST